jgi:hypothetical protein
MYCPFFSSVSHSGGKPLAWKRERNNKKLMMCDSVTHVMKPYLLLDFEERINIVLKQSIRVLGEVPNFVDSHQFVAFL